MIALIVSLSVIGGIFLIFAIVLACPVIADIQFKDSFVVKIKVLGIPITVFPQKEKPQPFTVMTFPKSIIYLGVSSTKYHIHYINRLPNL